MKCIIIDDSEFAREVLTISMQKIDNLNIVAQFDNAIDAIKFLNNGATVDVIFLDIHMPNFNGFDFIKTLKNPPQIILITTDQNFAADSFNYDCITDYLVKPIEQDRLERAINRVVLNDKQNKIIINGDATFKELYVNINKRLVKIDVDDIKYIFSKGDYIVIKTEETTHMVHTTLKKIEEKLSSNYFLKTHRSYVINLNKIVDIQDSTVLIGRDLIPISQSNRKKLMATLNLL